MTRATITPRDGFLSEVDLDSGHSVLFDAPAKDGGSGEELTPTEGVSASLAACTLMTLQFYSARKEWDLTGLGVQVETEYDGPNPASFKVILDFPDHLDTDQKERLQVVAGKCPVHRLLLEAVPVETAVA